MNEITNSFEKLDYMENNDINENIRILNDYAHKYGISQVICQLSEKYWYSPEKIADVLKKSKLFDFQKRTNGIKTIGIYYRNIKNGGAQRVVSELCDVYSGIKNPDGSAKYKVILLTDEEPSNEDYDIHSDIERVVLPDRIPAAKNFRPRFDAWEKAIDKYEIDAVVSGMWVDRVTFWDMLAVKGHASHPAFIIQEHSFCAVPYLYMGSTPYSIIKTYGLSDGVVTLSNCDNEYAGCFAPLTAYIPNPLLNLQETENVQDNSSLHSLMWCGRFSDEKNPLDMISAMKYVAKEFPDAVVYMVGSGNDEQLEKINSAIRENNLEENVILTGFTKEPEIYYKKSAFVVTTSTYEGFPLTHFEALSHHLPIVGYNMPWLEHFNKQEGAIPTPRNSPEMLGKKICELFENPEIIKKAGSDGYNYFKKFKSVDIGKMWDDLFINVNSGDYSSKDTENSCEKIILSFITQFQNIAKEQMKNENKDVTALKAKLQQTYDEKSEINKKLQQTYAEKSEINKKLQQTYAEKSEINKKLQQTYKEKSEINKKLQITYGEKADRGYRINDLEQQLNVARSQAEEYKRKMEEYKAQLEKTLMYKLKRKK